ncbi:MAG: hypothetical protein WC321_00040 [Candidatus Omnitrophota bacterium]|jgi:hypothetical protein
MKFKTAVKKRLNLMIFRDLYFLYAYHKNLVQQVQILRDYLKLKNNSKFLRYKGDCSLNRKVLVVSLTSDFPYQIKLEAILAKALQLAGCSVQVLTWKHSFWSKKYFRLFGINKFMNFEEYFHDNGADKPEESLSGFLSKKINFREVKNWRYKGCRIGQQVLSALARKDYSTPDLSDSKSRELFDRYLMRQISAVDAAEWLLDKEKPDILLFCEANGLIYGAVFDFAFKRGLNIVQFARALREDSLIFKKFNPESFGLHPNSISKSTFEEIKKIPWSEKYERILWEEFSLRYGKKEHASHRDKGGEVNNEAERIIKQLGLDKNKKTAVIFPHVLWDANLYYGEDIFTDYEEWFIETVKAACNNPKVNWIIKLHPANIWKRRREKIKSELREVTLIKEKVGNLPPHVYLLYPEAKISTFSLFKIADYGITVRGTVGMEMPCFGDVVFTAGTGRYSGLGFTNDSASKEDYLDKLSRIQDFLPLTEEQVLLAKKHAYAVFVLRPWRKRSFEANLDYNLKGIHPLDHKFNILVNSSNELSAAEDLNKFSNWVLNSNSPDYLERIKDENP